MPSNFEDDPTRAHQQDIPPPPPAQHQGFGFVNAADAVPGPEPTRTSSKAVASAVLGIFSLGGLFLIGPLSLVTAFIGLPVGWSARKEIRHDPAVEGEPWATTGIITSWIGIALTVLLVMLVVVLLLFGFAIFSGSF